MNKIILEWVKAHPIRAMFLVPIFLVAGISISHVVSWYNLTNPISWAIYLSIAIEIGAMTALLAATNKIKGGVWFMFGMVTFIQMIGNIFFSYKEIDANSVLFKSWVELTGPIWEMFGSDLTDVVSLKRWLAFLSGGLLPIISLTSLHFFVKYDELIGENNENVIPVSIIEESSGIIIDENNKNVIPVSVIEESSGIIINEFTVTELDNMSNVVQSGVIEEPIEEIVEELIEDVIVEPIEEPIEEIVEEPIEEIVEEPIEEAIEEVVEELIEEIVEEPIEEIVEEPIEEVVEELIEDVVEEPIEEIVDDIVRLSYVKTS